MLLEDLTCWRFAPLEDLFLMYLGWFGCLLSPDCITWIEHNILHIYL